MRRERKASWAAGARAAAAALLAGASLAACSVRRLAVDALGGALADSGAVFAADDDPELVRAALPFALKSLEAVLAEAPDDDELLLATSAAFTQFTKGFVEADAERALQDDYARALELRARAWRLYARARDYGLRALELRHHGLAERLRREPRAAVGELGRRDVELAFWTGAAWASAISMALDRPEVLVDLEAARALLERALALDESYGRGRIHEALISLEALPPAMGGSPERAREHFRRAVELSGGLSPSPYVTLASALSLPQQERAEFEELLRAALAVDCEARPSERLACVLAQRRARELLAQADELFLESEPEPEPEPEIEPEIEPELEIGDEAGAGALAPAGSATQAELESAR